MRQDFREVVRAANGGDCVLSVRDTGPNNGLTAFIFQFKNEQKYVSTYSFDLLFKDVDFGASINRGFAEIFGRFDSELIIQHFKDQPYKKDSYVLSLLEGVAKTDPDNEKLTDEDKATLAICFFNLEKNLQLFQDVSVNDVYVMAKQVKHMVKIAQARGNTAHDLEMTLNPTFSQYGDNEYEFMTNAVKAFGYRDAFKNMQYREIIKKLAKVISGSFSDDMKLSDVDTSHFCSEAELKILSNVVKSFPVHTKQYRDYLLGLPVESVHSLLINHVPNLFSSLSGAVAIKVSQDFLNPEPTDTINIVHLAHETYNAAYARMAAMDDTSRFSYGVESIHSRLIDYCHNINAMTALKVHFEDKDASFNKLEDFEQILLLLVDNNDKWLRQTESSNYIIEKLFKVAGKDTVKIIREVAELSDNGLTFTQWEKYIDNYDEHKIMPTSWWISLV